MVDSAAAPLPPPTISIIEPGAQPQSLAQASPKSSSPPPSSSSSSTTTPGSPFDGDDWVFAESDAHEGELVAKQGSEELENQSKVKPVMAHAETTQGTLPAATPPASDQRSRLLARTLH